MGNGISRGLFAFFFLALVALSANAGAVDVSLVSLGIVDLLIPVGLVGMAVLYLYSLVKSLKFVKAALFAVEVGKEKQRLARLAHRRAVRAAALGSGGSFSRRSKNRP